MKLAVLVLVAAVAAADAGGRMGGAPAREGA
jgi:hypothetical protein